MDAPELESLYRRWLSEVWGHGRTEVARELLAADLVDHNPLPGQLRPVRAPADGFARSR